MTATRPGVRLMRALIATGLAAVLIVVACEAPPPAPGTDASLSPEASTAGSAGDVRYGVEVVGAGAEVDEVPRPLRMPLPAYPSLLRMAGIEGEVVLTFVVDAKGRVDSTTIRVVEATNAGFHAPAKRAVAGAEYRPAVANGAPTAARVRQTITFRVSRLE